MSLKMLPAWTHEGLKFECTGCGQCCTGAPGYTWVSEDEIVAIAEYLNISIEEFGQKYLRKVGNRWSLLEDPRNFDCVFLKENKCQIYSVRPEQCKTFPWRIENLRSEKAWQEASTYCEGINYPDAPVYSEEEILERLSENDA